MKSIVKWTHVAPSWSEWDGGDPGSDDFEFLVSDKVVIETFIDGDYLDEDELEEFLELTPDQQLEEIEEWVWEHPDYFVEEYDDYFD